MSAKVLNHVFENSKTSGSARVLMLALADMSNNDGECWPGRASLARRVNVSQRQITRLVQQCERLGELRVVPSADGDQQNRYLIVGIAADIRVRRARKPGRKPDRFRRADVSSDTGVTGDIQGHLVVTPVSPESSTESRTLDANASVAVANAAPEVPDKPARSVQTEKRKRTSAKRQPLPRSEQPPYPVYDAVEQQIFGIPYDEAAPRQWTAPVGVIAKWLTGEVWTFRGIPLGKLDPPASAVEVEQFAFWWRRGNPNATIPRDVVKFTNRWRQWKGELVAVGGPGQRRREAFDWDSFEGPAPTPVRGGGS